MGINDMINVLQIDRLVILKENMNDNKKISKKF